MAQYHESKECCGEKTAPNKKPRVARLKNKKDGEYEWGIISFGKFASFGEYEAEAREWLSKDLNSLAYADLSNYYLEPTEASTRSALKPSIPGLPEGVEVVGWKAPNVGEFSLQSEGYVYLWQTDAPSDGGWLVVKFAKGFFLEKVAGCYGSFRVVRESESGFKQV